jgi:hypothetical protein
MSARGTLRQLILRPDMSEVGRGPEVTSSRPRWRLTYNRHQAPFSAEQILAGEIIWPDGQADCEHFDRNCGKRRYGLYDLIWRGRSAKCEK